MENEALTWSTQGRPPNHPEMQSAALWDRRKFVHGLVTLGAAGLREVGMLKSSRQKPIAEGIDWQFLNQLKQELKA